MTLEPRCRVPSEAWRHRLECDRSVVTVCRPIFDTPRTWQAQIGSIRVRHTFASIRRSNGLMARYQTQAVLRRASEWTPLVLVGITLDSTFYPQTSAEASGPLNLTRGLVALAPLAAVEAESPAAAAVAANSDARDAWRGLGSARPAHRAVD